MATKQAPRPPRGMVIQSVILSKTVFKTLAAAKTWIKDHGFKVTHEGKPPDETSTSFRFRQRDPGSMQAGTMRTIRLTDGVSAVVGRPKRAAARKGAGVCVNSIGGEASQRQVAEDLLDLIE